MHERRVNFAFGFTDGTWRTISVLVPERDDHVLSEDVAVAKALTIARLVTGKPDSEIAFRHVLSVEGTETV